MGLKWIDPSSGRLATLNNPPREGLAAMLRVIPSSPDWQAGTPADLVCTSKRQVRSLNCVPRLTTEAMNFVGITTKPNNEVLTVLIAAIVRLIQTGEFRTPKGSEETEKLREAAKRADPQVERKLKQAVEKDGKFGFSQDTKDDILKGLATLRPFLDKAIESLADDPSAGTLARLSIYFPPDPSRPAEPISDIHKIASSVRILLTTARDFLATPFDQLFKAVGKEIEQDRTIKTDFDANRDLIAI